MSQDQYDIYIKEFKDCKESILMVYRSYIIIIDKDFESSTFKATIYLNSYLRIGVLLLCSLNSTQLQNIVSQFERKIESLEKSIIQIKFNYTTDYVPGLNNNKNSTFKTIAFIKNLMELFIDKFEEYIVKKAIELFSLTYHITKKSLFY
jgi:hypothetical protein